MALQQLFTLAFALHLEPIPTLDYAVVPIHEDPSSSTDSLQGPETLRVGPNTRLEALHTRHFPHSIDTLSFLLNHTHAIDAVEPFAKLITLLDEADDDPAFRNLRDFFDARYDKNGGLVGVEKESTSSRKIFRSSSRAASSRAPARRGSQVTEGRKSSFAASLGGPGGLKLGLFRKNTDSQNHDASEDEDAHSRMSSSGHQSNPAPTSAPYIRLLKNSAASSSEASQSPPRNGQTEYHPAKVTTFPVRLDLHTVGLAAPPPMTKTYRNVESNPLRRVGSGRSTQSNEWKKRRQQQQSNLSGGSTLSQVASPDSLHSFSAAIYSTDDENASHSGFSRITSATAESKPTKSRSAPPGDVVGLAPTADAATLPSITEGAPIDTLHLDTTVPPSGTSPADSIIHSPKSSTATGSKSNRRPSMISKLLDFGRKKSFAESAEQRSSSPAESHGDESTSKRRPSTNANALGRQQSLRSGIRHYLANSHSDTNEEALDFEEEEADDESSKNGRLQTTSFSRRRSSAGSSGRLAPSNLRSMESDLRTVQEDGMFGIARISSRSSVGTTRSGLGTADEPYSTTLSAEGAGGLAAKFGPNHIAEGEDFISLFRQASNVSLKMIEDGFAVQGGAQDGPDSDVVTPNQDSLVVSEKMLGKMPADAVASGSPLNRTPQVSAKKSSLPSTPGRSVKSLDLDRSPAAYHQHNPIDANFKLGASLAAKGGEEDEAWWPCADVDPLPVSISSALGQSLGWEGIMHLCYGAGSRAAQEGDYLALGKAAAMEEVNKNQEKNVLAWRSGVASAGASPPKPEIPLPLGDVGPSETIGLADALNLQMELHDGDPNSTTSTAGNKNATKQPSSSSAWQPDAAFFGKRVNKARTWKHWQMLFNSIQGWVHEYETTRVRNGLAREIGLDPLPSQSAGANGDKDVNLASGPISIPDDDYEDVIQIPISIGSPQSNHVEVFQASSAKVDRHMISKVQSASRNIPHCVIADATNRRNGFRRRVGIPEGFALGPDDEEPIDYSWSRKKLSVKHFASSLTVACDSTLHYFQQLSNAEWTHRSAWELDYLEMCVFKTPLVAERFPPPGEAVVPSSRSYHPAEGTLDRTKLCPNPDENGAWDPDVWKRWLTSIKEGDIIVPAVGWQAWWTLISVLNGADRTGRSYDLQVKTLEEPFDALTDLNAVYL